MEFRDQEMRIEELLGERQPRRLSFAITPFRSTRVPLLVFVYAVGLLLFLAIEPTKPWILLVVTALVTLGADGVIREHPRGDFRGDVAATSPYLFLPALLTLGSGLFLEDIAGGYWNLPGIAIAAGLMAAVVYAEHLSVDHTSPSYASARFVLTVATYLTAFSIFAVVYSFDVDLLPAAFAVGLVGALLAVEVLREAEADPLHALVFAAVVGLIVAEARWVLYFLPLESYLAAVFLLLGFYLTSGMVQHHLTGDLRGPVLLEFCAIGAVGVAIVLIGRALESSGGLTP